ncbi:MAG: hypothetical protein ACRDPW_02005 [Mycobacteriales bacterium]
MKTYIVTATRWEHGWELDIDSVGVTQSHTLTSADEMVRDYVSVERDLDPDSFKVVIVPKVNGLEREAEQVRCQVVDLEQAQRRIAVRSRELAGRLKKVGLTGADTAVVLGVSPQRVSQLLRYNDQRTAA